MAVAFVNSARATLQSTSISLPALNTIAGNLVVVAIGWYNTGTNPVVSDTAGNSWTPLSMQQGTGSDISKIRFYYADNCNGNASNVISASGFSNTDWINITAVQYSGYGTITSAGNLTNGAFEANTGFTTGSFSPNANSLVALYLTTFSANDCAAGASYTIRLTTSGVAYEDRLAAPAGAQTASMTYSSNTGHYLVAQFTPAPTIFYIPPLEVQRFPEKAKTPRGQQTMSIGPLGGNALNVIIPPSPVPAALPERYQRMIWNPNRSSTSFTVGQPNWDLGYPPPGMPLLPEVWLRKPWAPPKRDVFRPGVPNDLAVVVPTPPPRMYGPDRFLRTRWDPPKGHIWKDHFPRLPFNPSGSAGIPWPPMLPMRYIRPRWVPTRSFTYFPPAIAPIYQCRGPTTGYVGRPFMVTVSVENSSSSNVLLVTSVDPVFRTAGEIPGYFGVVSTPGRPSLPTPMSVLYSASGWMRVLPNTKVEFAFEVVVYRSGIVSIGVELGVAIANDLGSIRNSIHSRDTATAVPLSVNILPVTG